MRKQLFIAVCLLSLGAQMATAATLAYWRFEQGPENTDVTHTGTNGVWNGDILDVSGNNNHLSVWQTGGGGYAYRLDKGFTTIPQTGQPNNYSVKNTGGGPAMWCATPQMTNIQPAQWTIEAIFKPEDGDHRTIVGRDSQGATSNNTNLSALYFKVNPPESVSVAFADVSGVWHEAVSADNVIQGYVWGSNPEGDNPYTSWYYMAAVSDGQTLSLYLANLTAGTGLQLVAQTDMTLSGSPNTAMSKGTGDGGDWDAGNWSVGRGLYGGGHVDRAYGFIDEVRISDAALTPDYFLINSRFGAWNKMPKDGTENYGYSPDGTTVSVDLSWNTGVDPANPDQPNPKILTHYLCMSADQNVSDDPNAYLVAEIPASGATAQATVAGLNYDGLYNWTVEEGVDNGSGVARPLGDPNNLHSPILSFGSYLSIPIITQQPARVVADAGDTAVYTTTVTSVTPAQFQWFKSIDNVRDETDVPVGQTGFEGTLTLTDVQIDDEAFYYCRVINDSGIENAVYTNMAPLAIRRLVAHWTLDQADYVGGLYQDISGEGHHADPNGEPTFVTGQLSDAIRVAREYGQMPSTGSWASAGTWNPSQYSGRLTVSFWMKWLGLNGTWQGFITKRSGGTWGNENVLWQISSDNGLPHLWFQSPRSNVAVNNGLVPDVWQFIVATFDGTTGKVYINGEQRASGAFQFGDAVNAMINIGGNSFEIGGQEWTNGDLDDLKFYNYALTELEVASLYVADAPGETACLQSQKPDAMFDLNDDCIVDIEDIVMFISQWLDCGILPDCIQ